MFLLGFSVAFALLSLTIAGYYTAQRVIDRTRSVLLGSLAFIGIVVAVATPFLSLLNFYLLWAE
jgi:hypothetical protein